MEHEGRCVGNRVNAYTSDMDFHGGSKLSKLAEKVQATFQEYRETQDYKTSILSTANTLKLSKASVTSYLPYRKGVYFTSTAEKGKISVGAERQRRYRAKLLDYPVWYADYEELPQTPYRFSMWQYSSTGIVPGIEGNVDLNIQLLKK